MTTSINKVDYYVGDNFLKKYIDTDSIRSVNLILLSWKGV